MWDTEEAKRLIKQARETDSVLAHKLADYLGYAMGSIDYYKSLFDKEKKTTTTKKTTAKKVANETKSAAKD